MSYNQIPQEVVSGQPGVYCAHPHLLACHIFFSHFSLFSHTCPKLSIYIACPAPWVIVSAVTTVYLPRMQYCFNDSITSPEVYPENMGFEI